MALNLNGGISTSGSKNSAQNFANSVSQTDAASARAAAEEAAKKAHERQVELLKMSQEYNSREAQKARDWESEMANTIYTRSVKNMKEAGINPILAANMGLSGASVGSGATASISTPSTFMGQGFMDQNSASHSEGSSYGSSWSNSENGLATGLELLGNAIGGAIEKLNASQTIEMNLKGLDKLIEKGNKSDTYYYSNKNKTGKDKNGNKVNHIASDINPEPNSFVYGIEQWMRARNLL